MTPAAPLPLDLRHLPPPQPMERILDALERLPPGGELVALTPSYPAPLLSALAGGGYVCDAASMAGGWRVTIRRANAAAP